MHVDLITTSANLARLSKEEHIKYFLNKTRYKGTYKTSILKVFALFDAFHIETNFEFNKELNSHVFSMGQPDFYTCVDLLLMLMIRIENASRLIQWAGNTVLKTRSQESYFDAYDVQPFRAHLFNSSRATNELSLIFKHLGYDESNPVINNYTNNVEFRDTAIKPFLEIFVNLLHDWEHFEQYYWLERYYYGNKFITERGVIHDKNSNRFGY